jgi:hypothetical protein
MFTKRILSACAFFMGLCLFSSRAYSIDCSNLPTQFTGNEFPSGNFFSNFYNPCYTLSFAIGKGENGQEGDLNALYNKLYYKVDSRYQLIVVGSFPNARYFSVSDYDEHSALSQSITDTNIVPLAAKGINPYHTGTAFVAGQQYAIPINFGGVPGTLEKGCMMNGFNVDVNALDGTERHQGMNWNADPGFFAAYPSVALHVVDTPQHTNPNTAGVLLIRSYIDITTLSFATEPHVIVRDVASGCALPASYVLNTLQIVTDNSATGNTWLNQTQVQDHYFYANSYQPSLCWGINRSSQLNWLRGPEYTAGANSDASYIYGYVPAGVPANLAAAGEVMRLRFRVPTTPPIPCTNACSRSGTEQMRYTSLSFQIPGGITLASLADSAFTQDPNGYVTLIVGTGATIPSWITPANGYTLLDLTSLSNYLQLNELALRDILPSSSFNCAGQIVPYKTGDATAAGGGLMGEYVPLVDYPPAATFPSGQPGVSPNCRISSPPPIAIVSVSTQCASRGCDQVVLQAQPPITISGAGFGSLPLGLPYAGTSNYLEVTDNSQNWKAGYPGDPCDLAFVEWSSNSISLVANVNQNGLCPLVAGDQLTFKVSNPQTMASATFTTTVAPD